MRCAPIVFSLAIVGCSSGATPTPTSPAPVTPVQLAGTWTGTLSFTFDGQPYSHTVTATIGQDQLHLTASMTLSGDWRGSLDGTLSAPTVQAQLPAHITLDAPSNQPPIRCAAAFDSTSNLVVPSMTFRVDSVSFNPCADTITNVTLTLGR